MSTPSTTPHASSSDLLAMREAVLARGGVILDSEIDALRAVGPCGAVGFVLDAVVCDHAELDDEARTQLVQLWNRQSMWNEARELAQIHAYETRAIADAPQVAFDVASATVVEELALLTGSGSMFAESRLAAARLLNPSGLLAETHACLARGWITPVVARRMAETTVDLIVGLGRKATAEQCRDVAQALQSRVLPGAIKGFDPATGVGCPQDYRKTRDAIRRAMHRIDPDRATRKRSQAHAQRGLSVRYLPDEGLAILTATLPIADGVEMFEHITDLAQAIHEQDLAHLDTAKAAADAAQAAAAKSGSEADAEAAANAKSVVDALEVRTLTQLRLDILIDALTRTIAMVRAGHDLPQRAPWRIGLLLDLETLTALREGRCELPGIGELDPELARILASDADWQTFIHSKLTGEILDQGSGTYRPSEDLRNFIRVRDPHCTFPGCRKRSHRCQLDHIRPFPHGPTTRDNLHPLCQHHHNLKTHGGWTVTRDDDGTTTWTSPRGVETRVTTQAAPDLEC